MKEWAVSVEIGLSWSQSTLEIAVMAGEGVGGLSGHNFVLITVHLGANQDDPGLGSTDPYHCLPHPACLLLTLLIGHVKHHHSDISAAELAAEDASVAFAPLHPPPPSVPQCVAGIQGLVSLGPHLQITRSKQ